MINSYDFDGVVWINDKFGGLTPNPWDIIITGRSFEEAAETYAVLQKRAIDCPVFFNPLPFENKTRESSGEHKARVINQLLDAGVEIGLHFDDDPVQADVIGKQCPRIKVALVTHGLNTLENVRHSK